MRNSVRSAVVLLLCAACGTSNAPGPSSLIIDQPRPGQAIITGTTQTIRWHGGTPGEMVDVRFVPAGAGASVLLAAGVPNTGSVDVVVHLIGDDQRAGGTITVQSSGAVGASGAPEARAQALGGADGGAGEVMVGCLAGFSYNGTSEEYFWMDVTTGQKQTLGTVGDLESWSIFRPLAIDHDAGVIYIVGNHGMQQKLYVLDAKTGALLRSVATGANSYSTLTMVGHRLLAFYYDVHEEMVELDPLTGAQTIIGQVGDLTAWSGQAAYDAATDTMYVLGMALLPGTPMPGPLQLYALNATTGVAGPAVTVTLNAAPVDQILGALLTSKGALLGFRFDQPKGQEQLLRIDTKTGIATPIGTVGDLTSWSSVAQINLTTDTVYVIGNDPSMNAALYAMDGDAGTLLYKTPLIDYPTQGVLVY